MQCSNWLLYITDDIFLGPGGVVGIVAPIRYVHGGCHGHISKSSLMSIGSYYRHTLAHTGIWLLYITDDIFLGPGGVVGIVAPIRHVHGGCHGHISKSSLMSIGSYYRHTLAHTVVHKSNDASTANPAGFIFCGWG